MSRRKRTSASEDLSVIDGVENDAKATTVITPEPKTTPTPTPTVPSPKKRDPNAVALRVYVTAGNKRYDKTAGFQNYAKRMGLGPMTIPEWREAEKKFQNLPVK